MRLRYFDVRVKILNISQVLTHWFGGSMTRDEWLDAVLDSDTLKPMTKQAAPYVRYFLPSRITCRTVTDEAVKGLALRHCPATLVRRFFG